jgi:hypothetical protein
LVVALEWVGRITTVALEMVLPGLAGSWLDQRWGTGFLALAGFALGITAGIWHLLRMTSFGADVSGTGKHEGNSRTKTEKDDSTER